MAKTFDVAAILQRQKHIKDIITEDGTEFKQGMISGGNHSNIFNLSLGTVQLDQSINQAIDRI